MRVRPEVLEAARTLLDQMGITAQDLLQADAVQRRNFRGGTGAGKHLIAALRCVYRRVVADRLIADADDPAKKVGKPRRPTSQRIALPDERLGELVAAAATGGRDPELDALIVRFHIETATLNTPVDKHSDVWSGRPFIYWRRQRARA